MKQEEIQEKLILYQLLQKHFEELRMQGMMVERKMAEFETTRQALEDIKNADAKNETLVPLGSGLYTYGKITDKARMLVDIGAGVMVNKEIKDAAQLLEGKKKDLGSITLQLQREMENVAEQINSIAPQLERALQEMQEQK
ncbi:MAG: prefoldin subunit alpha [Candidatus Aenigmarchaeota archaeon]|nr:prefoldin subunit alpha [Candidatus Aenigmarchaeota archaeon]